MAGLEAEIKEYTRSLGVQVVGVAGPERLDGPPSLDPNYSMRGARSVVSMALPMDVPAIYDFLAKRSPAPHNLDQFISYQRLQHIGMEVAGYLRSLGYRAASLPVSADYRRSPYVFSTRPAFSLRLGAVAAGIAAQGWSGNVVTEEYGAALYLGAVVTSAVLESDPMIPASRLIELRCSACMRCVNACPSRMFEGGDSEFVLSSGELRERGRRRNIDLCNISCFGLHSLSTDRRWTNWGRHWIESWLDAEPDPSRRLKLLADMLGKGLVTGDSTQRFDVLRRVCSIPYPDTVTLALPALSEFPAGEDERHAVLAEFMRRIGITGIEDYPVPMICGQCALVCGPTPEETAKRYRLLSGSGLVVPGEGGRMTRVDTFEEAAALRRRFPLKPGGLKVAKDIASTSVMWHRYYFGFEPKTAIKARAYRRRLRAAVEKRAG